MRLVALFVAGIAIALLGFCMLLLLQEGAYLGALILVGAFSLAVRLVYLDLHG